MRLIQFIKDRTVRFDSYRQGLFYYQVNVDGQNYQFTVPADDIGDATLMKEDKASFFMRWIRPALENGTLVKVQA